MMDSCKSERLNFFFVFFCCLFLIVCFEFVLCVNETIRRHQCNAFALCGGWWVVMPSFICEAGPTLIIQLYIFTRSTPAIECPHAWLMNAMNRGTVYHLSFQIYSTRAFNISNEIQFSFTVKMCVFLLFVWYNDGNSHMFDKRGIICDRIDCNMTTLYWSSISYFINVFVYKKRSLYLFINCRHR